ncbi:hypothetical protein [Streptomyces sp. NPDC048496]|uniref:hypothetical protein n=1 Tax=Streptomyces sp. NPDC048496 TaxID=3365558 RepID=UPI00372143AC
MRNAIPQPGGGFTPEQAESFGDACSLLDAVIAACSARISAAASADETEQLQAEQEAYLHERRRLAVIDDAAVARIRRDYPARLRKVRGENA